MAKINKRSNGGGGARSMRTGVDKDAIRKAVLTILRAIGESPEREGLVATPRRIADMYEELFSGLHQDPKVLLSTGFEDEDHKEMVLVKDIPFYSMCLPSRQLVDAVGGGKRAADIRIGDWLYTLDHGQVQTTRVVAISSRRAPEVLRLMPKDSAPIHLTPEHPVMTPEGWRAAGDLKKRDMLEWVFPRRYAQRRSPIREGYDLGYVLGAVAADASIQDGRRITLCVRDRPFAERFAAAFEEALGRRPRVEAIHVPSGVFAHSIPMFRVRVVSTYIAGLMVKWGRRLGPTTMTKEFSLPYGGLRTQTMTQGFLDGCIDAGGAVMGTRGRMMISGNFRFSEAGDAVGSRPVRTAGDTVGVCVSDRWHETGRFGRRGIVPSSERYDLRDSRYVQLEDLATLHADGRVPYTVYTFTCAPLPTFCVAGVLTHNCEHHLMPFHGLAHVGYIPQGRIVGISKIARVVETLARRPQVQERLTSQIADLLMEGLKARGAAVVIEAQHLCMTMRGVKKPGSRVVTSATRGIFRENPSTRAEFLSLVRRSGE